MTQPIHSVQRAKTKYRRFQLLAISSAALTVLAVFFATVSGQQVSQLRNTQLKTQKTASSATNDVLKKQIEHLRTQLADNQQQVEVQKQSVKNLTTKVTVLEKQLAKALNEIKIAPAPPQPAIPTPDPEHPETSPSGVSQ